MNISKTGSWKFLWNFINFFHWKFHPTALFSRDVELRASRLRPTRCVVCPVSKTTVVRRRPLPTSRASGQGAFHGEPIACAADPRPSRCVAATWVTWQSETDEETGHTPVSHDTANLWVGSVRLTSRDLDLLHRMTAILLNSGEGFIPA